MLSHLLFMRHAKSSWNDSTLTDHERTLTKRGKNSADAIARALSARGYPPDLIWASDSTRTKETAKHLIRTIPGSQKVIYCPEFYHATPDEVLATCAQNGEPQTSRLMLLGHNPAFSALYEMFSGQHSDFPTGACGVFKRKKTPNTHWLAPENWHTIDLILPRELIG